MSKYKETTGYIIHCRDFKNSSLILEFFSKDFGLIHLIAKGIKKNKLQKPQLNYFSLIKIQFYGKSSLKTLTTINLITFHQLTTLIDRTSGLYFNELLHLCLNENEKVSELFECYHKSLIQIINSNKTHIFRNFERKLLEQSGFEIDISSYQDDDWLTVNEIDGLTLALVNRSKIIQVHDVKKFLTNKSLNKATQKNINKLMYELINLCVSHREIHSRKMLVHLYQLQTN